MIPATSPSHPAGTIGIISGDLTRYADFSASVMTVAAPVGSKVMWSKGVGIAENLNRIVRQLHGDWLWMLGDDHVLSPDTLLRLLAHQVPIVIPMCAKRKPPLSPVIYGPPRVPGKYPTINWPDLPSPEQGLFEVYASGTAGMLVRREVLDAIGDPWFEEGKTTPEHLGEDLWFCEKARQAGYTILVDLGTRIGHLTPITVWPEWHGTAWGVSLDLDNGVRVAMHTTATHALKRGLVETPTGARVNLGSGEYPLQGYLNVDLHGSAEIRGDFRDLEFKELAEVRMEHALEHVARRDVAPLLERIWSWLRPGGTFHVEVPDMAAISRMSPDDPMWHLYTYGAQSHDGEYHLGGFTAHTLVKALVQAGFLNVATKTFLSSHPMRLGMPCLSAEAVKP